MKIKNRSSIFIIEDNQNIYLYDYFIDNFNVTDDIDEYVYNDNEITFLDGFKHTIDRKRFKKLNDKFTKSKKNYDIIINRIKKFDKYLIIYFSNNDVKIINSEILNINDFEIDIDKIVSDNKIYTASDLYDNGLFLYVDDFNIPYIINMFYYDENNIYALFENGIKKHYDVTNYTKKGILVDKDCYEQIYKYGTRVN